MSKPFVSNYTFVNYVTNCKILLKDPAQYVNTGLSFMFFDLFFVPMNLRCPLQEEELCFFCFFLSRVFMSSLGS